MKLTWYGHAAFLLEGPGPSSSIRIMLDPYRAPDVGSYAPIDDPADIVAISHVNEKYHSHLSAALPVGDTPPVVVNGLDLLDASEPHLVNGVSFSAVRVWENPDRVEPIAMVGVEIDGIRILHMGDCGHPLSEEEVAACGRVDVLLALAGAGPTIALPDLAAFIQTLNPRIVIPMHFLNEKINLNLRPVSEFLDLMPPDSVRHFDSPTVTLTADALPARTEVWVLPPAR
ncbi:MAG: MBL fold metallo-hydrolase [Armatimonadaceae bacterium]